MKRLVIVLSPLIFALTLLIGNQPALAAAFDPLAQACSGSTSTQESVACKPKSNVDPISGTSGIVLRVANLLAYVGGIIAVFMIVLSGFKYITSSADPAKVTSAKDTILYAVIGLVVLLFARAIVVTVIRRIH